jgi:hypothetical protein
MLSELFFEALSEPSILTLDVRFAESIDRLLRSEDSRFSPRELEARPYTLKVEFEEIDELGAVEVLRVLEKDRVDWDSLRGPPIFLAT